MARVKVEQSSYAAGYIASLLDVAAEYEGTVVREQEDGLLHSMALREGWRDALAALGAGSLLPSELASRLGRDRSTITRVLRQLRSAGLVRTSDDVRDGRTRPHHLTARGRLLLASMSNVVSTDVENGVTVAVRLFQHLLDHKASPAAALEAIAEQVLGDSTAARAAVRMWAAAAERAGILGDHPESAAKNQPYRVREAHPALTARSTLLWQSVPAVLHQRKQYRQEPIPVYVRTGGDGWAAWAHALHADDARGASRTIVDGDLVSGAVMPPSERFDLLYDDPSVIRKDRDEPTMQAFIEQADAKFVVTCTELDIPEGFIPLELQPPSRAH